MDVKLMVFIWMTLMIFNCVYLPKYDRDYLMVLCADYQGNLKPQGVLLVLFFGFAYTVPYLLWRSGKSTVGWIAFALALIGLIFLFLILFPILIVWALLYDFFHPRKVSESLQRLDELNDL